MFQQLLAITRNTFFESIRQPIMLVVLVAASVLIVLSNPLSAFTMDENQRMQVDIGLATVFLAGAVLAAFIATNVLGREIENKTALTVISKPVTRPIFLIGKYLGVSCAMCVAAMLIGDPSYFPASMTRQVGQVVRSICILDHPLQSKGLAGAGAV